MKEKENRGKEKILFFSFFAAPLHHTAQRTGAGHTHTTVTAQHRRQHCSSKEQRKAQRKLQKGYIFTVGCSSIDTSNESRLTTHD